ncbi:MAG: ketohydroxyglutarate aldolase [Acidobacteria bacterium]|nr:ketohydroxyglutarate aldolase [Acidobacteriota bacterium]
MSVGSGKVQVLVTVEDQFSGRLAEVADSLRAEGLAVENLLEALGTISGFIEQDRVKGLSRVKGVAHVEQSRQFQLEPPDSEIQ